MRHRLTTLALLAATLTGCLGDDATCYDLEEIDPEAAYALTEDRWERNIGPLPADITHMVTRTYLVSDGDFGRPGCMVPDGVEGRVVGCSWWDPLPWEYTVELLECRPLDETRSTAGHEHAHNLHHFVYGGDGDPGHEDERVWGPIAAKRYEPCEEMPR